MKNLETKSIVIGIGNTGRRDDGLGWRFLELLENTKAFKGRMEYRYQLQIEDAELISNYDQVIFVDASRNEYKSGYSLDRLEKKQFTSFTSHAIPSSHILALCQDLFNQEPEAYQMAIQGSEWGLELGLSPQAESNLRRAFDAFLKRFGYPVSKEPNKVIP